MKKALILLSLLGLVLAGSSCKRSDIADPTWDDPAGFHILVEGSVAPAVQVIDGYIHSSQVYVRVTDGKGTPLANRTVLLRQLDSPDTDALVAWGYFQNNQPAYQANTDANGVVRVTYYWPLSYYSEEMWIHAMLVIDGRAAKESETGGLGNIPQDFIALTMIRSGVTSAPGAK